MATSQSSVILIIKNLRDLFNRIAIAFTFMLLHLVYVETDPFAIHICQPLEGNKILTNKIQFTDFRHPYDVKEPKGEGR